MSFSTGVSLTPGGGFQFDSTFTGLVDFYTSDGANGFDSLQLDVTGGLITYNGNGLFSVGVSTSNELFSRT